MRLLFDLTKTAMLLLMLMVFARTADAQKIQGLEDIKSQADLDKTMTALDAEIFDSYNRCDLEKFRSFFVADVEFYHDQGGLTSGAENLTESVKNNICGKVTRELVPGICRLTL